jgi:hypothetical protein
MDLTAIFNLYPLLPPNKLDNGQQRRNSPMATPVVMTLLTLLDIPSIDSPMPLKAL